MFAHLLGFAGMVCVVTAYHMVTTDRWQSKDVIFNWVNLVGAVMLIISLFFHFNLGSFVIEIFWIAIAGRALARAYLGRT